MSINDFSEIKECYYKGEHYSVRDNGSIFRLVREGKRKRKDDETWTFGRPNESTGYMEFCSERVHRIVAFAFLGEPPTPQHIVDLIDTNRRNNRSQNLRWLTKLENALINPITRKKIEYLCGSIEAFINNPSIIQDFVHENPNFEWMRTVTPEEAKNSYERLCEWAKTDNNSSIKKPNKQPIGEWIYTPMNKPNSKYMLEQQSNLTNSLSINAMQRDWRTPTLFPLCPSEIGKEPLIEYKNNLKKGKVVSKNQHSIHIVEDFVLYNDKLYISTYTEDGIKHYSVIIVSFENGKYIHEGEQFFGQQGTQKFLTLAQGLEWEGEDGIDDYC